MELYIILCLIAVIYGLVIALAWAYRKIKELKDLKDEQENIKQLDNIDKILADRKAELSNIEAKIQNELIRFNYLEQYYNNLSKNAQELQSQLETLKEFGTNQVNGQLEKYKKRKKANIQDEFSQYIYTYEKKIDQVAAEINDIGKNLKDLKKKQEVINYAILRKRKNEKQVGCYKVIIPKKIRKIYKPQKSKIQLEIEKLLKS